MFFFTRKKIKLVLSMWSLQTWQESTVPTHRELGGRCNLRILFILFREREQTLINENHDNEENKKTIINDSIMASSTIAIEQPSPNGLNAVSDEEGDTSSMSLDSEGKRKMAEFDEKIRERKEQFAEENRIAMERIEGIKEEFRASQDREDTITQEIDEMKLRYDKLEDDVKRLDEVSRRREREEKKWRKKMDKRRKENARRLEKVRAERLLYLKELQAENGLPEGQNVAVHEIASTAGNQKSEECNDAKATESCSKDGASKEHFYEPTEYSSVEQLEKRRKELRRLEKLEKKAMKKAQLERKEQKKIEKKKRKVERKLAKANAKASTAKGDLEVSKCDKVENISVQSTLSCDAEDAKNDNPDKEHVLDVAEEMPSQNELDKDNQKSQPCDVKLYEAVAEDKPLEQVLVSGEREINFEDIPTQVIVETEVGRPQSSAVLSDDGSSVMAKLEEYICNESLVPDHSDGQRNISFGVAVEVSEKHITDDAEKEESLEAIGEDLINVEEEIDFKVEEGIGFEVDCGDSNNTDERSPVFNQPSPLIRKKSGIMTSFGLQPFAYSPENLSGEEILDDVPSSVEDLNEYQPLCEKRLSLVNHRDDRQNSTASLDCFLEEVEDAQTDNNLLLDKETREEDSISPDDEISEVDLVDVADNIKTEDIEVSTVCEEDLDYMEDALCEDDVITAGKKDDAKAENKEVSSVRDEELKYIEDVMYEEDFESTGEDEDGQTGDTEVSRVHGEDADYIEDVACEADAESVEKDDKVMTEDMEVSSFHEDDLDFMENVMFEDHVRIAWKEEDVEAGDKEVFSVSDEDLEFVEDVSGEERLSTAEDVQTEDIEVSGVDHDEDLDCSEDVRGVEDFNTNEDVQREDIEVSAVHGEDLVRENNNLQTGNGNGICRVNFNESPPTTKLNESHPQTPSYPVSVRNKGVYTSASIGIQKSGEQKFIDEFDELLDQAEEEIELEDSLSHNSLSGKENCKREEFCAVREEDQDCDEGVQSVMEDDSAVPEDKEVSTAHDGDIDYIEDVNHEDDSNTTEDLKTEDKEVSLVHDEDLDYIKWVRFQEDLSTPEKGEDVQTEDIEVSSVHDEDLDYTEDAMYEEDIESAREDDNVMTEDIKVSTVHDEGLDYTEDVRCEEDLGTAEDVDTEDIEASSIHDADRDYIEEVRYEEDVELDGKNDSVMTEVSAVHDKDLDYIEEVRCEEDLSAAEEENEQTEDIEGCAVLVEAFDYIEDVSGEEGLSKAKKEKHEETEDMEVSSKHDDDNNVQTENGDEISSVNVNVSPPTTKLDESHFQRPSHLVSIRNKGVYTSASIGSQNSKEQEFIDEFDELLNQAEEEFKLGDTLSHNSFSERETSKSENIACSFENEESPTRLVKVDEIQDNGSNTLDKVTTSDVNPQAVTGATMVCLSSHEEHLSQNNDDKIVVVDQNVEPPNDKICFLVTQEEEVTEITEELDCSWGSFFDMGPPLSPDEKGNSDGHEVVEFSANDIKCNDENKETSPFGQLCLSLQDNNSVTEAEAPFADIGQDSSSLSLGNGNRRGKEMVEDTKLDGEVFIAGSESSLGNKEDDVLIEETEATENNSYSSLSNKAVKASDEESSAFADESSHQDSASASDADIEDSMLSSCEQEVPDIKDDVLSVISEEQEMGDDSHKDVTKVPAEKGIDVKGADGCNKFIEDSVQDSFTSLSELDSEALLYSSCDQEVADSTLSTISEDEDDDPDSWDVLDDVTLPCCRSGKCTSCSRPTVFPSEFDDGLLEESSGKHAELVAAVVNISEQLLQQEASGVFKAAPVVEKSREFNHSSAEYMAAEECHLNEAKRQLSLEEAEERNKALKEISDFTNRQNEKLMDQVITMKEEARTFKMENESLQTELETVKLELRPLKDNEQYKDRELSNLRDDIETKGRKLEDVTEDLDYAHMDKNDLLCDIKSLEEKLQQSEESNEELTFRVDELKVMLKELETTATYGHLREEVELLKGSLILSKHREQIMAADNSRKEAELSKISANGKDEQLRELKSEQERVITQLQDQLLGAEQENSRLIELKGEQDRIMKQVRDKLATVEQENSTLIEKLNAETLTVSQKEEQLSELKVEQARIVDKLKEELVSLESENARMTAELSEGNPLLELKEESARITAEYQKQVAQLKKENERITAELLTASEKLNQLSELQDQNTRITVELHEQVANLEKENSRMLAELSKASDRDKQLRELQEEKAMITARLQNKRAKLKKVKSKMVSKISDKNSQLKDALEQVETLRNQNKLLQDEAMEVKKQLADKMVIPPEEAQADDKSRSRKESRKRKREIRKLKKRVKKNEHENELLGRFIRQRGGDTRGPRVWQEQQVQQRDDMEKELDSIKRRLLQKEHELHKTNSTLKRLTETTQALQRCVKEIEDNLDDFFDDSSTYNSDIPSIVEDFGQDILNDSAAHLEAEAQGQGIINAVFDGSSKDKDGESGHKGPSIIKQEEDGANVMIQSKDKMAGNNGGSISNKAEDGAKGPFIMTKEEIGANGTTFITENDSEQNMLIINTGEETPGHVVFINISNKHVANDLTVNNEEESMMTESQLVDLNQILQKSVEDILCVKTTLRERQDYWKDRKYKSFLIEGNYINEERIKELQWHRNELDRQYYEMEELKNQFRAREQEMEEFNNESMELAASLDATVKKLQEELARTQDSLNSKTSLLANAEEKHEAIVRQLQGELESTKISLNLQTTLLVNTEERYEGIVKQLQADLESMQTSFKEKTGTLEETEGKLQQQTTLLAIERERYEAAVKQLREDLESMQISFTENKKALEETEGKLQQQTTLLAIAEERYEATVKQLHEELESMQTSFKENQNALEETERKLQHQTSLLLTAEEKHEAIVKQLEGDLKNAQISFKKITDASKDVKRKLGLKASLLARAEAKLFLQDNELEELRSGKKESNLQLETTVKQLKQELEKTQVSLKEKTILLEQTLVDLQSKTSFLAGADAKREHLVKQLEDDLQRTQKSLKEKEIALEKTELDLQLSSSLITSLKAKVCQRESELEELQLAQKGRDLELERVKTSLDEHTKLLRISDTFLAETNKELVSLKISLNRKSQDVEQMKFALEPTQDELKLVSAELVRAKNEKAKLIHDVRAANSRLDEEKVMADSNKNFLQKQINSAMKDQEINAKQLCQLKMNLKESRSRISRLESEKREMEEYERDYKEKVKREINRLKLELKASKENNKSSQSRIDSAKQENCALRWENQRLKAESLQKYFDEMAQSCGVDVPSRPLMVRSVFPI